MPKFTRDIKILHFNAQSITPKAAELAHILATHNIDICSVNETWLSPTKHFSINNYTIIRKDRISDPHGGVCLLIHKDIQFDQIIPVCPAATEVVAVKIKDLSNRETIVATLYNPPSGQQTLDTETIKQILSTGSTGCPAILLGDLNCHHPFMSSHKVDPNGQALVDLLVNQDFFLVNTEEPTYFPLHRPDYSALLDLAICNEQMSGRVSNYSSFDNLRSDHIAFIVCVKFRALQRVHKHEHLVKTVNWNKFNELASDLTPPSSAICSNEDLDDAVSATTRSIQTALAQSTTTKTITIDSNHLLVLPKFILNTISERRAARRKYQATRSSIDKTEFNRLTALVKLQIKKFKASKWQNFCTGLNSLQVTDRKLWRSLNSIDNSNKNKPLTYKLQDGKGKTVTEPAKIAKIFAEHMYEVFTPSNNPNFCDENFERVEEGASSFFTNPANELPVPVISEQEVALTIKQKIGNHGAPGEDTITNKAIRHLPASYITIITNICNASLQLGHVPDSWKSAIIVMIPKPNKDHSQPGSFRPISLLSTLSKLLERIILVRIHEWLDRINLLSSYQAGFRPGRQTKDQILRLVQEGLEAFNINKLLGCVFIDIEKAFDNVWHNGTLFKLNQHNVPNYLGRWIRDYLDKRRFKIRYKDKLSTSKSIQSGVPQGSVLGPILFLIFFNDIVKPKREQFDTHEALFADDVAMWTSATSITSIRRLLQKRLDEINEWMNTWRTVLNASKTVYTIFNKGNRFIKFDEKRSLTYNDVPLKAEKNFKFLGVTLDPGLTFNAYTKTIQQRALKRINMLRSIKGHDWGASTRLILTSYKVLVRPLLEYAPFTTLMMQPSNTQKLITLQNAAIRAAMPWPTYSSTVEMSQRAKLEQIEERAKRLTTNYINKAYHTNNSVRECINFYLECPTIANGSHAKSNSARQTVMQRISDFIDLGSLADAQETHAVSCPLSSLPSFPP